MAPITIAYDWLHASRDQPHALCYHHTRFGRQLTRNRLSLRQMSRQDKPFVSYSPTMNVSPR